MTKASGLHPRNKHQGNYPLAKLCEHLPALKPYLVKNKQGEDSINFADPQAVLALNKALLLHDYGIEWWEIPEGFLCPPIPGRADYIHHLADLITPLKGETPATMLDIGTGSNLIYPIIGACEYGWQFVGAEVEQASFENAKKIVANNALLTENVSIRQQPSKQFILKHVITEGDYFTATLCNPPFYKSADEANTQTQRKQHGLKSKTGSRNFGGQANELWCTGGEFSFIKRMIRESKEFASQVGWFTSLVSNNDNIKPLQKVMKKVGASDIQVVEMKQGKKVSRFIAWRFTN